MASPPSVIVGIPALEPRDFLEEIDNLKLPHGGGDLAEKVAAEINLFQDIAGWQHGESRNRLIGDIAEKIEGFIRENCGAKLPERE